MPYRKEQYGSADVLKLKEVEKPALADDEVLVKIHAASVNAADWRLMRADPFLARLYIGLLKPTRFQILGADIAKLVEAISSRSSGVLDIHAWKAEDGSGVVDTQPEGSALCEGASGIRQVETGY